MTATYVDADRLGESFLYGAVLPRIVHRHLNPFGPVSTTTPSERIAEMA